MAKEMLLPVVRHCWSSYTTNTDTAANAIAIVIAISDAKVDVDACIISKHNLIYRLPIDEMAATTETTIVVLPQQQQQ